MPTELFIGPFRHNLLSYQKPETWLHILYIRLKSLPRAIDIQIYNTYIVTFMYKSDKHNTDSVVCYSHKLCCHGYP